MLYLATLPLKYEKLKITMTSTMTDRERVMCLVCCV